MANFKTHITTSSLLGVGVGAGGWFVMGIPADQCLLAGGLCGLSGMLPDLDSPNSVPVRETVALLAALIPALMVHRFEYFGLSPDQVVLACGIVYFGIRFGVAQIFKRYTVHRGMWHSIPAAMIAALLALMICSCDEMMYRVFKGVAVFIGFISHLVLDEIYSIDLSGARIRVKKSSGTALKFWGGNSWANFSTYAKLAAVLLVLSFDPMIMNTLGYEPMQVPESARAWLDDLAERHRNRFGEHHGGHNHGGHSNQHSGDHDSHSQEQNPNAQPRIYPSEQQPRQRWNSRPTIPPPQPRQYERPRQVLPIERWPRIEQSRASTPQGFR